MIALGFIETKGLLASIEGADAMVKAANVHLLEKSTVGSGLVTITVGGDVASVRAAVDAGVAAISQLDPTALVSHHMIARPASELHKVITVGAPDCADVADEPVESPPVAEEKVLEVENIESVEAPVDAPAAKEIVQETSVIETPMESGKQQKKTPSAPSVRPEVAQLKKMTVSKLRQLARSLDNIALDKNEIKFVKKKSLIDAIIKAYRQIEE